MTQSTITITRMFDAPREAVWKAWTEPEHMKRWWGPKNFTAPVVNIDFREGGKYLSCMHSADGHDFWSTGTYKEIVPMERIVCTDSFADPEGNIVSASTYGMAGLPLEFLITIALEDAGEGKTKMTLTHEGFPEGEMRGQCIAGWNESFDKMENALK